MRSSILALCLFFILSSCSKESEAIATVNNDALVFGHFYGMCMGETCVETFMLSDTKLFEDTLDDYTGQQRQFVELSKAKFDLAKDLLDVLPADLLNTNGQTFGCPDCADGGGLFIQHSINGITKTWLIDQNKAQVPTYLHSFMDSVNAKIDQLQ